MIVHAFTFWLVITILILFYILCGIPGVVISALALLLLLR